MNLEQKLTIQLIRSEIAGIPVDSELINAVTHDVIESVYIFSIELDVAYIVGSALSKLGLLSGDDKTAFFNQQLGSLYRYEQLNHELDSVSNLFESEEIKFIPLKGSVIREYYPKPEMRTSCDVDVLIHKEELSRARKLFEEKLNFVYNDKCGHDISFWSPANVEVELHHTLFEHDFDEKEQLDKVWQYATPCEGFTHKHELDKAFFMFYHIVHMAKHVRSGGCGIRPFLDLVILEDKFGYDKDAFMELISKAGLETFTKKVFDVAHMWFGTMEPDETSDLMAEYVFGAGAYGSIENQVARNRSKGKSKFKSILSRVFISRRELEVMYPTVKAYPILTPVFEVVRWGRIVFKDKGQKQMEIIKQTATLDQNKIDAVSKLMDNLGL